jgi:hypothetical protein
MILQQPSTMDERPAQNPQEQRLAVVGVAGQNHVLKANVALVTPGGSC